MGRLRIRLRAQAPSVGSPNGGGNSFSPGPTGFILSFWIHVGVAIGLFLIPPASPGDSDRGERSKRYDVVMLPKEKGVLWLPVNKTLPDVSPARPIGTASQPQGREKSREESIVVQPPGSVPGNQLIWRPEAPTQIEKSVPAPNMIAVEAAAQKPPPKAFVVPQSAPPPPPSPQELTQPPTVDLKATMPAALPATFAVAKPKPRSFIPPKEKPRLPVQTAAISEAPPDVTLTSALPPGQKAGGPFLQDTGLARVSKPEPRRFMIPNGGIGTKNDGTQAGVVLESAPQIGAADQPTGTVTSAVIGLDPGKLSAPLPDGSRLSSFSRAPNIGDPSSGQPTGGLNTRIPGVSIQGSRGSPDPAAPTVPPAAPRGVSFEIQITPAASTLSAPLQPASRRIPRVIESRFPDRSVYTLVIPKPSLPEYTSDWTIWFAERSPVQGPPALIRAPAPVRKLTHLGAAGGGSPALPESWVQITAVIDEQGKVQSVMPLPSRNQEASLKAARDVAQWEFRPAVRNGVPVAVEVVIEMSIRDTTRLAQQQ
jgi:hypothetical protein